MYKLIKEKIQKLFQSLQLGFVPPPMDGMQNASRMKFLYEHVLKYGLSSTGIALEVGVFQGCSLVYLSKACQKKGISKVYGIDLFTGTPSWNQNLDSYDVTRKRINEYKLNRIVTLIKEDSHESTWTQKVDMLHIDADHQYEAVKKDIEKFVPYVNRGGLVIFDDYDNSHIGVKKAVHELLRDNEEFSIVGINYQGNEYGSICIRRDMI